MLSCFIRSSASCNRAVAVWLAGLGLFCGPACGSRVDAPMAESSSSSSATPPALPDLGSEAVVCGESGDQAGNDDEVATLAGCQIYRGSLSLGRSVTSLSPLASLRILEGRLSTPGHNSDLETLDGLEQLQSVGELVFSRDGLRVMSGVPNLREVKGAFKLFGLTNLTDLDGLENLEFTGRFEVSFNAALVDFDGLSGLQRVEGDLYIDGNPELTGLDGLVALEHVTGDLYIRENPKVPKSQIDALLSRVRIDGEVHVD